jgi:ABC-2 type transport system ATP-binding protein
MARIELRNATVEFAVKIAKSMGAGAAQTGGRIDIATGVVRALEGVTLDIGPGSRIGLIGHNGAGKSTLLRVMAGVYAPVRGEARIEGRVATLFNATPGLNIDSTGRENIITCGLHLGLGLREVKARIDDIAAFTELGPYLELPVRIYSTGMLMRLGFAIATSLEPDILLIDEGLGTGDAAFAAKAEARMRCMAERASIVVVASHSSALLAGLCTHGVVLQHGRVLATGPIETVLEDYHAKVVASASQGDRDARRAAYAIATEMVASGQGVEPALEEQALLEALEIKPGDLPMLSRLRQVRELQGKREDPALELEIAAAALRLQPENAEAAERMLDVMRRTGLEPDPAVMALVEARLSKMTGAAP